MKFVRSLPGVAVVLVTATLGSGGLRAASPTLDTPQYVALGSSYAAGPGITPAVPGSPPPCARSAENYAHVVARERSLSLVDVTCSGATTVDVLHAGQFGLPAQLAAVTAETQLVTVTIGGNDVFFMTNLFAMSCDHESALPVACATRPDALVNARFAGLPDSLRQVVAEARRRSPKVRIVFVNYFTVLPEQGTCARIGLTAAQADEMRAVAAHLADITRKAAAETGAGLLDVASLSRAHNACSSNPWVLGARREEGTAIPPFHPTREAMHAVGEALNDYLAQIR
jgi:lysophospholipase L1-like esterase